jgi:phytoene synthase
VRIFIGVGSSFRPKLGNVFRVQVAPPSHVPSIAEAYEVCRQVTYTHAKTFYFASHFIAPHKRNACYAVYAFCRYVDDLIDVAIEKGDVTRDHAVTLVAQWRNDLDALYAGAQLPSSGSDDPTKIAILTAWEDTLATYRIPRNLPDELIEGVLMDTIVTRFETFDELYVYCYKVASVVGLMTSEIFGYSSKEALAHAIELGVAMQLTNILRDVGEDADRGRIYLPQDDLDAYGVTEDDIMQHRWTPQLHALVREYTNRAESYYASSDRGVPMLDRDSRTTVYLMSMNYRKILRVVESMDYNIFLRRARTTMLQKILSIPAAWLRAQRSA